MNRNRNSTRIEGKLVQDYQLTMETYKTTGFIAATDSTNFLSFTSSTEMNPISCEQVSVHFYEIPGSDSFADSDFLYNPATKIWIWCETPRIDLDRGLLINSAREGFGCHITNKTIDMDGMFYQGRSSL
ncbi:hypothetical protein PPL_02865 [Heterostelium album PN500]|uniref:Uncharacterized protein n=1 Tax=Heterostelium pallidum (strain ATCC 26659 / Pp 5 / PN500) TaxID=670386 RepID=D3B399_HETP5|nr:hypothetical protein PPL_02865 [Heterostelium album PN500]EFA83797.1 hypothetical protein PPL_02865 [Heterostelium album PN500]|eukprot:XP_020435914.1 hypothetical protein PPL_02865 [Heterostelium album PN500]